MAKRKRPVNPEPPPEPEHITLPSDVLRELVTPDTFRVWHDSSDPHQVGEFVVTVSQEGVTVYESHSWPDGQGLMLTWPEVFTIGGRARELVDDLKSEIREIQRELQTWVSIRSREAQRIARAREVQRTEHIRALLHTAGEVSRRWMPSDPARVTWRDMVRRKKK
jgi:hypothetical protein